MMEEAAMTSTGANVQRGMHLLHRAGFDHHRIAADLGLTARTTRRWAVGRQQPRAGNLAALRDLVHEYRRDLTRRTYTTQAQRHADDLLFAAVVALQSDAERAELAALGEKVAAHQAEINARPPVRSITRDVDPFALCHTATDPVH